MPPAPRTSALRQRHRSQLVDAVRGGGPISRADLSEATGLSRTTVSTLVSELIHEGVVVEEPLRLTAVGSGRPPVGLRLNPALAGAVGVDFGHTHVRVVVGDLASTILAERELELDVDRAARDALDAAIGLVADVLEEADVPRGRVLGVGMGLPGPIDADTGVVGSSVILSGWAGLRPRVLLERRLGLPVLVDNDANLGALGELTFGAGRGARHMVYVKISSGIGAGLVIDGALYRGSSGVAGEFGHVLVDPDGAVCRCGNRGCLETVAATGPLLTLLRPTYGEDFAVTDLVTHAREGDAGCTRVLADAGRALGLQLAAVCNTLNPERIVIGGELSAAGDPLLEGVRDSLSRYAQPATRAAVDLVGGVLGNRAEVLGAVALALAESSPERLVQPTQEEMQ